MIPDSYFQFLSTDPAKLPEDEPAVLIWFDYEDETVRILLSRDDAADLCKSLYTTVCTLGDGG